MLSPGTFAIFKRGACYRDGDVLLVEHPRFGKIVKRAIDVSAETLWLEGANANSLSRETMGPIEQSRVQGKLVFQISGKK